MADINITGPDGSSFTFPAGTSGDVISGAMQSHYNVKPAEAAPVDPYHQSAQKEFDALKAQGVPVEAGYARRIMQGATFGGADEALAAMDTPLQMIKSGTFNPVEGYKQAKAFQDVQLEDARKRQGALGSAAEIAGSLGSAGGIGKAGFTLAKDGAGILSRSLRMGAEGAGYGGVQGALDSGNSIQDRAVGAGKGILLGGAVGGALPAATGTLGILASPILSNIRARVNPGGVATSQVARAVEESGRPVGDIVGDVQAAANEGQPMFTVADAMGFPGQRLLRTGISANGPGRAQAVDFLEQRQAGQGRRISNQLSEGFQAPQTAQQTESALTAARDKAADVEYGAVRGGASPVDLSGTIAKIDATLNPGVNKIVSPQSGIANDSVESALSNIRSRLTDGKSVETDFTAIQRARGDLADQIEVAKRAGQGNKVRLLNQVKTELDAAMEASSPGFKQANANFAARSKVADAVQAGQDAAKRGRVEDTVPAFRSLNPREQSAYRVGYAEPHIESTQGSAIGANKARPFTSDAFQTEAQAIAPMTTGNRMMRQLGREQTMFETRGEATGGSKTDMNLADQASQKIDPGLLAAAVRGDVIGLGKGMLSKATDALNGYTPAVREKIVQLLLDRGANPTTEAEITKELSRLNSNRAIAAALGRGATIGAATYLPRPR